MPFDFVEDVKTIFSGLSRRSWHAGLGSYGPAKSKCFLNFFGVFRGVSGLLLLDGLSYRSQKVPNRRVLTSSTIWRSDQVGWGFLIGVFAPKTGSRRGFWAIALERIIISSTQIGLIDRLDKIYNLVGRSGTGFGSKRLKTGLYGSKTSNRYIYRGCF